MLFIVQLFVLKSSFGEKVFIKKKFIFRFRKFLKIFLKKDYFWIVDMW